MKRSYDETKEYPIVYGLIDKKEYLVHLYKNQNLVTFRELGEVVVIRLNDLERLIKSEVKGDDKNQ